MINSAWFDYSKHAQPAHELATILEAQLSYKSIEYEFVFEGSGKKWSQTITKKVQPKRIPLEKALHAYPTIIKNSSLAVPSQESELTITIDLTITEWIENMKKDFYQWCVQKAKLPESRKLAWKYYWNASSRPNAITCYFTGAEVTDWFMWYLFINPFKGHGPSDVTLTRKEVIAIVSGFAYLFQEFQYKSYHCRGMYNSVRKMNIKLFGGKAKAHRYIDSKYTLFYSHVELI